MTLKDHICGGFQSLIHLTFSMTLTLNFVNDIDALDTDALDFSYCTDMPDSMHDADALDFVSDTDVSDCFRDTGDMDFSMPVVARTFSLILTPWTV